MFCRNCGKKIGVDDKFCVYCGFKTDVESEVLDTNTDTSVELTSSESAEVVSNNVVESNTTSEENGIPATAESSSVSEENNTVTPTTENTSNNEVQSATTDTINQIVNTDNTSNQTNNYNNFNNMQYNTKQGFLSSLTSMQKGLIIGLLSLFLILLVVVCFTNGVFSNTNNRTRTIMMYIDGADLETSDGLVSADLKAINPSMIDLEKTNILIYTGGTKKWHNFIKNDENAIYILKKDGFEKLKTYPQKNMGDPATFSEFLNYAYDNYKADVYNLIMYDHGGAIHGAIYDDFTNDRLSLTDLSLGLKNSPFNKNNKLQAVLFRTCLNGTLEVSTVFVDYADYFIASEEITYGGATSNVLSFLNNVSPGDSAIEFGKKFFARYDAQIQDIDFWGQTHTTYSVVDLSKVNDVVDEVNKYFSSIDVKTHYNDLARIRSSVYQYGVEAEYYDTIDLYDYVQQTSSYSSKGSKSLLSALDKAIVHNHTDLSNSHGMSIYLPYRGNSQMRSMFLSIYKDFTQFKDYYSFIAKFDSAKSGQQPFSFDLSKNATKEDSKGISMTLTDDQVKNYGGSAYVIFQKDPQHPNFYYFLYSSNDAKLEGNTLTADIGKNMIKIRDKSDPNDKPAYIYVNRRVNGDTEIVQTNGMLLNSNKDLFDDGFMSGANIRIAKKNGKPEFSTVTANSTNERINGTLLNINDFTTIDLPLTRRRLLDAKGKVMDQKDWEASPEIVMYEMKIKDVELSYSGLDEGDYYCIFFLTDINNNEYHSELIKIGG